MSVTNQPIANEIRSMYRVLRDQVKRLKELAPANINGNSANDADALTWQTTIRFVSNAKVCLDDLAANYEDDPPQDVKEEQEQEMDDFSDLEAALGKPAKPQGRSSRRARRKNVKTG